MYRECVAQKYDIFASLSTLEELERVLHYPKFGLTALQIALFFEQVLSTVKLIDTEDLEINLIAQDPADNRFLECAVACNADFLITGNKHLLNLCQIWHTKIVTVTTFYEYATKDHE